MSSSEKLFVNIIGQAGAGKSTTAKRMAGLFRANVFQPSSVIRAYAQEHDILLKYRADYVACHRELIVEDPEAMIRPILETSGQLILIDGLRLPAHTQELKKTVGMRTLALAATPEIRFRNIKAAEQWRAYRDEGHINNVAALIADEAADNHNTDPYEPNVEGVMADADHTITIGEHTIEPAVHLEATLAIAYWLRQQPA